MLTSKLISAPHGFFYRDVSLDDARHKLGADAIITNKQVHSNIARYVSGAGDDVLEGDALITDKPGIALAVYTADCGPILMFDEKAGVIAAVHAGWKGARNGVIESAVNLMAEKGAKNIVAVIGPCIQQKSYEVGAEFLDNFLIEDKENKRFFVEGSYRHWKGGGAEAIYPKTCHPALVAGSNLEATARPRHEDGVTERYLFNLPAYIKNKLKSNKLIKEVAVIEQDTLSQSDTFCSFRRGTISGIKEAGRQISAICLK